MRFFEIQTSVYCYAATVKAKRGNNVTIVKTMVFADGFTQAKALLQAMYGDDSVVSLYRIAEDHLHENGKKRITPRIVPGVYKHNLLQKKLLQQIKLNAMRVMPTAADIEAVKSEFEVRQKRMNRRYEEQLKWADIRRRRLARS